MAKYLFHAMSTTNQVDMQYMMMRTGTPYAVRNMLMSEYSGLVCIRFGKAMMKKLSNIKRKSKIARTMNNRVDGVSFCRENM